MPVYQSSITPIMKIQIIKAIIIGNIIDCQTPYDVGSSYKYAFKRGIEGHGLVIEGFNYSCNNRSTKRNTIVSAIIYILLHDYEDSVLRILGRIVCRQTAPIMPFSIGSDCCTFSGYIQTFQPNIIGSAIVIGELFTFLRSDIHKILFAGFRPSFCHSAICRCNVIFFHIRENYSSLQGFLSRQYVR